MRFFCLLSLFFLSSCASQIMASYEGKPVQDVMLDYGPPVNAFDMPDGRRAFQWAQNTTYTTPIYANTTGNFNAYQYGNNVSGWTNSNTVITGGQTYSNSCVYTMFAEWVEFLEAWMIVGYKKPDLMCE